MRRARDRAIDIAIAPLGTAIPLPDPDVRGRVGRCVSHVGLAFCRYGGVTVARPRYLGEVPCDGEIIVITGLLVRAKRIPSDVKLVDGQQANHMYHAGDGPCRVSTTL